MVFAVEQDRILNANVLLMAWCPCMDMLALILSNSTLEVRRLSWQRLGDPINIDGNVSSLVWKPDGKVIALGYDDGRLRLVSVDRDQIQELSFSHQSSVTALYWIAAADKTDDLDPLDGSPVSIPRESRVKDCFDPLLTLPKESGMNTAIKFIPTKLERTFDPEQLCVLISGDEQGIIKLHALGAFPIGDICIRDALSGSWFIPRSNRRSSVEFVVHEVNLSRDLRYLNAAIRLQNARQPDLLVQVIWDVSLLRSRYHEIRALATQSSNIEFLLKYVHDAVAVGSRAWKSARKTFDMKFSVLETLFREHAETQPIADSLIALVVAGTLNQALLQFFSTCLPEQSASRIAKAWTSACDLLLNLIDCDLRRALEELNFRLSELRGLARCQGCDIGLNVSELDDLLEYASHTLMKVEEMYRIVLDVRLNFLQFFTWALEWAKQSSDNSGSNLPSLVESIDLDKVVDFISKDLGSDRIQKFFDCDALDEGIVNYLPVTNLQPYSKLWSQHQSNSLQTEISSFVGKWREFRTIPNDVVAKSFTLCSVLPLAHCTSETSLSLCSRLDNPFSNCLAFLHQEHIVLVLSNNDNFEVSVFRLSHGAVQIGFHNDTHLAVLSRDAHSTQISLVDIAEILQSSKTKISGKDIGAQVLVEALSPENNNLVSTNRQRSWRETQGSKIAVCGPRGMVSWLSGPRRVVIVDVVNDEDDMVDV